MSPESGSFQPGPPTSRDLPPYQAVLVVDARRFSDNPGALHAPLNATIVQLIEAAFTRAGMADVWDGRRFPAHTGDGYSIGFPPEKLPHVLHPFLRALQDELWERDQRRLAREPQLRLRASVHVGPLPENGVGAAMTEVHRLLDSDQARQALDDTHADVTFLAAIVSERVYQDVVAGGYTLLHPSQFRPVEATAKRFAQLAYLYVPEQSLNPAPARPEPEAPASQPAPRRSAPDDSQSSVTISGNASVGDVAGRDIHRTDR